MLLFIAVNKYLWIDTTRAILSLARFRTAPLTNYVNLYEGMEKANTPFGKNIFTDAFRQFDEETFFQRLTEKVRPQSFYQKYKGFKNIILALSYLFNLVSILTASYLVFWFIKWITGIPAVAYLLSGVFLFFIEQLKRKSSTEFFQVWFFEKRLAPGWLVLSCVLFGASVASSFWGTTQGTHDFAPPPPLITQDSILTRLNAQLDSTEVQIADARATRWRGTTTNTSQATIKELTTQKSGLLSSIQRREEEISSKNTRTERLHETEIKVTSTSLAWIVVAFELLFEACIAFIWYYYYRSVVERGITLPPLPSSQETQATYPNTQGTPSLNGTNHAQNAFSSQASSERRMIGFQYQTSPSSQNVLQHVATGDNAQLDDKYTIEHKDARTGEIKRYTLARVENFISHYERVLAEAKEKRMEQDVIENRQAKLTYWLQKKSELIQKMQ